MSYPRLLPILPGMVDYYRYASAVHALETMYTYNPIQAGLVKNSEWYTPANNWLLPQAYNSSPAFDAVIDALVSYDYSDMVKRDAFFTQALQYSLNDTGTGSVRVWLAEVLPFVFSRKSGDLRHQPVLQISRFVSPPPYYSSIYSGSTHGW
jgi:hypothetical protein